MNTYDNFLDIDSIIQKRYMAYKFVIHYKIKFSYNIKKENILKL